MGSNQDVNTLQEQTTTGIRINEVMFNPAEGGFEWIELKNAGSQPIDISGWGLTDEDGNWYRFPNALPEVPIGAFVVVIFDGEGKTIDDYDFSDNVAVLHSQTGLVNILEDNADQVSLYTISEFIFLPLINGIGNAAKASEIPAALQSTPIASFVAWGDDPGQDASNAIQAGIWAEGMYKSLNVIGEISMPSLIPGQSVGLLPGTHTTYVDGCTYYPISSTTQGEENPVPNISLYDPVYGATIDSATFAIGWQAVDGATGYKFQMDNNSDFSSPEYDLVLTGQAFVASSPVPEGTYYWRAKVLLNTIEGTWSSGVEIHSLAYPITNNINKVQSEKTLGIGWQLQRKDTNMICLAGDNESDSAPWDSPHPISGTPQKHGSYYCERASISMLASYYGGHLSQERIAYNDYQGTANDLGHGLTNININTTLNWAGIPATRISGKPSFSTIISWIDANRPLISLIPGHFRVIDGYRESQSGGQTVQQIHLLDPWDNARWVDYADDVTSTVWVGPAGSSGAPNVRSDEDIDGDGIRDTVDDSDGDGLVDFDERERFHTNPNNPDSDGDGVPDKADIREYVFDNNGNYEPRRADFDGDGLRKELDRDNDSGGSRDGCEDTNHNGKLDQGETSNFDPFQEKLCLSQIAFDANFEGNREIYIINDDGSNRIRLTNNSSDDRVPKWSPDGTKIAFCSDRDGQFKIYTLNSDGSNQIKLIDMRACPDGWSINDKIVFSSDYDGDFEIYTINSDGSDLMRLTYSPGVDFYPSWNSSGTKIAFASYRDGNYEIYTMNSDGSELNRLTNNSVTDSIPEWIFNDTKIAFGSIRDGTPEIYIMNIDGSEQTRLTNSSIAVSNFDFSPDYNKIAFTSSLSGHFEVHLMNSNGTGETQLTYLNDQIWFVAWKPWQ